MHSEAIVAPLKALCCTAILPEGTVVEFIRLQTPNRALILDVLSGGFHRVKLSALRRVTNREGQSRERTIRLFEYNSLTEE